MHVLLHVSNPVRQQAHPLLRKINHSLNLKYILSMRLGGTAFDDIRVPFNLFGKEYGRWQQRVVS